MQAIKNKGKDRKKKGQIPPTPPSYLKIDGGRAGVSGSQSRKPNFAIIYRKLRDFGAKIDRTIFFRDYAKLLAKREVLFILDDLNSAFFINSKTGEAVKGEVVGVLKFKFHLGEDDSFVVDFKEGGGAR